MYITLYSYVSRYINVRNTLRIAPNTQQLTLRAFVYIWYSYDTPKCVAASQQLEPHHMHIRDSMCWPMTFEMRVQFQILSVAAGHARSVKHQQCAHAVSRVFVISLHCLHCITNIVFKRIGYNIATFFLLFFYTGWIHLLLSGRGFERWRWNKRVQHHHCFGFVITCIYSEDPPHTTLRTQHMFLQHFHKPKCIFHSHSADIL